MHSAVARLGLGVAQFGLDGGRAPGRPAQTEVREMLHLAARSGIRVLDTGAASSHGETVIGAMAPIGQPMSIIVKAARGDRGADHVEAEARASLLRLGLERADAIVVQSPSDLFTAHGEETWERLRRLRAAGLFARIGISAYVSDDPLGLARRFKPDLIQAPASLLDQRLLMDGSLARIREMGIDVHLRSIFLNGILFLPPDRAGDRSHGPTAKLFRARRLIAEGRSDPLQAALGFALSRPEANAVIVGAATVSELTATIAAASRPPPDLDWDDMALPEPELFDRRVGDRRQLALF